MMNGELCVMTVGVLMMELLLVVNWDFHMLGLTQLLNSGKEQGRSGWTTCCAQDLRINCLIVFIMDLVAMIALIVKMQA